MRAATVILIAGLLASQQARAEVKVTSVADISLFGGQYYLDGDQSSFGGNSSIYYSPSVSFTPNDTVVPVVSVEYRGTKDVQELVGGGTLTQEDIDAGLTLKYIKKLGSWTSKLRGGYRQSWVNETEDEGWGDGLFDYNWIVYGITIEHGLGEYDLSLSGDYYTVAYPNYESLVSDPEYENALDTGTYTEISENAGKDVLDYNDTVFTLNLEREYRSGMAAYAKYMLDLRKYSDQTIVQSDGSFSSDKRADMINSITLGMNYVVSRTVLGIENETVFFSSDQNSYDADATRYTDNYYSYCATEFTPAVSFYMGNLKLPSRLKFWWDIEYRKYSDRLAQNSEAEYLDDKVSTTDNGFGLSFKYPLRKNLFAALQFNRRTASSNMKYEAGYKYNYTVSNYMLGLDWQY